jgi:hypothetical protein
MLEEHADHEGVAGRRGGHVGPHAAPGASCGVPPGQSGKRVEGEKRKGGEETPSDTGGAVPASQRAGRAGRGAGAVQRAETRGACRRWESGKGLPHFSWRGVTGLVG